MLMNLVWSAGLGRYVKFCHRGYMTRRPTQGRFAFPGLLTFLGAFSPPPVTLPIDSTGNLAVSLPMDGNDQDGDCGLAMACHADNILMFRQGKGVQSSFDVQAILTQYFNVSGGDNGLDENQVVNQIWKVGLAGNPEAIIVDSLDIDVKDVPLAQFAIDNFYTIQMAFSCPDDLVQNFATGRVFLGPAIPNPRQGHFVPLADVSTEGHYHLITWGSYVEVDALWVATVQPQTFLVFSPRQFDKATGLDSKGRHISTQAALWSACGGNTISPALIASYPPIAGPVPSPGPAPAPVPSPPGPAPVPAPPAPAPVPAPPAPVPVPPGPQPSPVAPTSGYIAIDVNAMVITVTPDIKWSQGVLDFAVKFWSGQKILYVPNSYSVQTIVPPTTPEVFS